LFVKVILKSNRIKSYTDYVRKIQYHEVKKQSNNKDTILIKKRETPDIGYLLTKWQFYFLS